MNKLTLAVLTSFVMMSPLAAIAEHADGHKSAAPKAQGPIIHVGIDGMVCDFCAQSLKKVFLKDKAVQDVGISLEEKTMTLTLKLNTALDDAVIKKHVDYAGYKVRDIHRMPKDK